MNACLQCLVPIGELRDHYMTQSYLNVLDRDRTNNSNNFDFSDRMHQFYVDVFRRSSRQNAVISPTPLTDLLRQRFNPTEQHDSHEFICYLLEQL